MPNVIENKLKTYLCHCHHAIVVQDTQNFAMILLENARLPTSAFNNIVSLVVASAKEGAIANSNVSHIQESKLRQLQTGLDCIITDWSKL